MDLNLKGKRALVCGSTQGIGKASAIELASLGATVTLLARDESKLKSTLSELSTAQGQKHDFILADFSKADELKELVMHQLRDTTYQILVNNTGGPAAGNIIDATPEQFESAFRNHLICNHILATLLIPGMKHSTQYKGFDSNYRNRHEN